MKKFLITGLMLGAILFSATGVQADNTISPKLEKIKTLLQQQKSGDATTLLNQLTPKEAEELASYVEFKSQEVPPIYFIFLADSVYKNDKDKALLFYNIGKVRAYEDVMMCKDNTAKAQLSIYPSLAPKTIKYLSTKIKNKKYIADLMQKTLDWDTSHPDRYNPIWACYHGISAKTNGQPQLIEESKRAAVIENARQELKDTIKKYSE